MRNHASDMNYDSRCENIFGRAIPATSCAEDKRPRTSGRASVARTTESASSACESDAGPPLFLSAEQVVHDLLNMPKIRDPERWLKRHRAPIALTAGRTKRFLAEDIVAWARLKFG